MLDLTPYENDSEALFGILEEDGIAPQLKDQVLSDPDATKKDLKSYLKFTDKQFDDLVNCLSTYKIEVPEIDTPQSSASSSSQA
jgi:hypothetical protein